jgi:hypothetical protein
MDMHSKCKEEDRSFNIGRRTKIPLPLSFILIDKNCIDKMCFSWQQPFQTSLNVYNSIQCKSPTSLCDLCHSPSTYFRKIFQFSCIYPTVTYNWLTYQFDFEWTFVNMRSGFLSILHSSLMNFGPKRFRPFHFLTMLTHG